MHVNILSLVERQTYDFVEVPYVTALSFCINIKCLNNLYTDKHTSISMPVP